jgi:NitT/TauT family transport system permease protein
MTEPRPRPEYVHDPLEAVTGVVRQPLTLAERLTEAGWLRKGFILGMLALAWEIGARLLADPLVLPTFSATVAALWQSLSQGDLLGGIWLSVRVLLVGYALGVALAAVLTFVAISSRFGSELLATVTSLLNPLPAIALVPIAMLWFGLGEASLVFVLVHAVLWPVALSMHAGFAAVSPTLRMVGHNYGLRGPAYAARILVPAAFPSILSGLKVGWAFAWRTLIAAELVFGVASGTGGLGWFIYEHKNNLDVPAMFAGLLCISLIGLLVENLVFRPIEAATVRRWGMQA